MKNKLTLNNLGGCIQMKVKHNDPNGVIVGDYKGQIITRPYDSVFDSYLDVWGNPLHNPRFDTYRYNPMNDLIKLRDVTNNVDVKNQCDVFIKKMKHETPQLRLQIISFVYQHVKI